MTALLEKLFAEASKLPAQKQEAIVTLVIHELLGEFQPDPVRFPHVERRGRNLYISGGRVTIYQIMDYLKAEWTRKQMQEMHSLSDIQIDNVLAFIDAHRELVEAEYQEVVRQCDERQRYWEDRNRDLIERVRSTPPSPEHEALYRKLAEWRVRLGVENDYTSG